MTGRGLACAAALVLGSLVSPGPAQASNPCAPTSRRVQLIICVDTTNQTARALDRRGNVVLDLGTITSSRIDTDCPKPRATDVDCGGTGDHITTPGVWAISCMDPLSVDGEDECNPVSPGLHWLLQFSNGTAFNTSIHGYRSDRIGKGWDSHGCIRAQTDLAAALFAMVLAVGMDRVHVHVTEGAAP